MNLEQINSVIYSAKGRYAFQLDSTIEKAFISYENWYAIADEMYKTGAYFPTQINYPLVIQGVEICKSVEVKDNEIYFTTELDKYTA